MKTSLPLVAVLFSAVGVALASPVVGRTPPITPLFRRDSTGSSVAGIGQCPMDCWNEAAATAGCDPNKSDKCLCGAFFDDVAACTADTCGAADNLAALDFMEEACN
ncbi:hypothetical protein EK21DRAFT_84850 [Setomelanomma holmii]|uniref:CFEM domain-containing protein n=1 Tax=Setomelanomma holmii TaxID=210430 RepID=A0A9P4HIK7_9PLEO|nr:hypothetical protein EK21DRAFT_84850 [Setomelanomma holmii]